MKTIILITKALSIICGILVILFAYLGIHNGINMLTAINFSIYLTFATIIFFSVFIVLSTIKNYKDNKTKTELEKIDYINNELVCSHCGSNNVQMLAWVDVNTSEYKHDYCTDDDDNVWCNICQEHVSLIKHSEYKK
jgi:hypothetical protein